MLPLLHGHISELRMAFGKSIIGLLKTGIADSINVIYILNFVNLTYQQALPVAITVIWNTLEFLTDYACCPDMRFCLNGITIYKMYDIIFVVFHNLLMPYPHAHIFQCFIGVFLRFFLHRRQYRRSAVHQKYIELII